MQQNYSKKIDPIQKATKNTASSVLDASSQSEALQRKADMANNATQREEAPRPNNTGMPDNLKSGIESLSGFSMDDVRVHYNSSKPATVQALAYTQGTDIHVAPGQEKHLPHEAWHVAQQMAGRVSPTTNINGMPVNDNAGLEHEADVMGEKAVQCKKGNGNVVSNVLQCERNIIQCNRDESQSTATTATNGSGRKKLTIVRPGSQSTATTATNGSGGAPLSVTAAVGVGGAPQPTAGTLAPVPVNYRLMGNRPLPFLNQLEVPLKSTEVFCAADIDYHLGGEPHSRHAKNAGSNVGGISSEAVQQYFKDIGLKRLGDLKRCKKGNPPGACAEPHAVQKALETIQSDCDLDKDGMKSSITIDDIFISDSVIGVKNDVSICDFDGEDQNKVPIYERCLTCQQWIAPNGHVKPEYLQIIRPTSEDTPAAEPDWATYKATHAEVFYKILPKPTKGDSDGKIGVPLKNYNENRETYFHNVDFRSLTELMAFNERLNATRNSQPNLPLPNDFIKSIIERHGIRTVIKKEMLKVMAKQLGLNLDARIDHIAQDEKDKRRVAKKSIP